MRIILKATLYENINEIRVQGQEVDDDNDPVSDNIPNLYNQ